MSEVFCKDCIWHQEETYITCEPDYGGMGEAICTECQHEQCFTKHGVTGEKIRIRWGTIQAVPKENLYQITERVLNKNCDCQYYKAIPPR